MVRKLLKQVGREMMEIEAIKDNFLQPFKAQGAVDVDDYGFVISTKFMAKPGIPFARPRVRVVVDDESEGSAASIEQAAVTGVAASVVSKAKAEK